MARTFFFYQKKDEFSLTWRNSVQILFLFLDSLFPKWAWSNVFFCFSYGVFYYNVLLAVLKS